MTSWERKILQTLLQVMSEGAETLDNNQLEKLFKEIKNQRHVKDRFWTVYRFGHTITIVNELRNGTCEAAFERGVWQALVEYLEPSWKVRHPVTHQKVAVKEYFERFRERCPQKARP